MFSWLRSSSSGLSPRAPSMLPSARLPLEGPGSSTITTSSLKARNVKFSHPRLLNAPLSLHPLLGVEPFVSKVESSRAPNGRPTNSAMGNEPHLNPYHRSFAIGRSFEILCGSMKHMSEGVMAGKTTNCITRFHVNHQGDSTIVRLPRACINCRMSSCRLNQFPFTGNHHFGFEEPAWYCYFIDVMWLCHHDGRLMGCRSPHGSFAAEARRVQHIADFTSLPK